MINTIHMILNRDVYIPSPDPEYFMRGNRTSDLSVGNRLLLNVQANICHMGLYVCAPTPSFIFIAHTYLPFHDDMNTSVQWLITDILQCCIDCLDHKLVKYILFTYLCN